MIKKVVKYVLFQLRIIGCSRDFVIIKNVQKELIYRTMEYNANLVNLIINFYSEFPALINAQLKHMPALFCILVRVASMGNL